jgi:hypothetical protein
MAVLPMGCPTKKFAMVWVPSWTTVSLKVYGTMLWTRLPLDSTP